MSGACCELHQADTEQQEVVQHHLLLLLLLLLVENLKSGGGFMGRAEPGMEEGQFCSTLPGHQTEQSGRQSDRHRWS